MLRREGLEESVQRTTIREVAGRGGEVDLGWVGFQNKEKCVTSFWDGSQGGRKGKYLRLRVERKKEMGQSFLLQVQKAVWVCANLADNRKKIFEQAPWKLQDYSSCTLRTEFCMFCSIHFQVSILSALKLAETRNKESFRWANFSNLQISILSCPS